MEQIAATEALPHLFEVLAREVLELLRLPASPRADEIRTIWDARAAAQATLCAWASLIGDSGAWHEATWAPLKGIGKQFISAGEGGQVLAEDLMREAEVVLWFSSTLAASWPERAGAPPAATAVLELRHMDGAPEPWRTLLWSAACNLAATAPAEHCPRLIEWMLERSPYMEQSHSLLEFTELSYAQSLEMACRQLPRNATHTLAAQRMLQLALAEVPPNALHKDSSNARALLLRSMRHMMGGDTTLLCQGLSAQVLPVLRQATMAEAAEAEKKADPPWHAARTLFATLVALLPPVGDELIVDSSHPIAALWRSQWDCLQAALLKWPASAVSDQPVAAAAEALGEAASRMPVLFPDALQLLSQSASQRQLPDAQLKALRKAVLKAPCPPLNPERAAELLGGAVLGAAEGLIGRPELQQSPTTLVAFFGLLAATIPEKSKLGCSLYLRSLMLAQPAMTGRCLGVLCEALPSSTSAQAAEQLLSYGVRLFSAEACQLLGQQQPAHRAMLAASLPRMCAAFCRALALQEHLVTWEGLVDAAQLLYSAAELLPAELPGALVAGLEQVPEVPDWSRARLEHHVAQRKQWPKRSAWICEMQQIAQEWQRERRQAGW